MTDHHAVEVGGIRLAYRLSGPEQAPPLVLLHALGEHSEDWDGVTSAFSRGRQVYAVDLRGHGNSDWPGTYSLELMRADVLGLLDALGLAQVDLVGHSMGGVVAYLVAAESPERVRRLVLEDVPAPLARAKDVPERPPGEFPFDWDMVVTIWQQLHAPDPSWLPALRHIKAPTLVVAGGDRSHLPQDEVALFAQEIPDARLITINAGHLVHATEPAAFTGAVLDFLGATD